MPRKEIIRFIVVLCFGLMAGCDHELRTSNTPSASGETEKVVSDPRTAADPLSNVLKIDGPMMAQIKVERVGETLLPSLLVATGKVQFNDDQMARILTPVNGQVQQLGVKVGEAVQKNERLFFLKSREVAVAVTEHLEDHKDLDLAEKKYAMAKDLFEHRAVSHIALQQAESDLAKAKARVARTEEALRVLGLRVEENDLSSELSSLIPITAPLGGTVIERRVTDGQFVQPDSNPLLIIADLSSVWVLADIFERDLHRVHVGQRAEVRTEAYPEHRFLARVSRIGDVIDPATRTVKVRFLVSNPGALLKPEMFASVTLILDESAHGLTIPAKALFSEGGRNYVYLRSGELEFTRREVEIATEEFSRFRVTGGLKVGDQVVTQGAILLRQQEKQN
jgi:cobalt-zinc-cadmium efflux system membrane fusion protein